MAAYNALQLQHEKTIIKKNNFVIRFLKFRPIAHFAG